MPVAFNCKRCGAVLKFEDGATAATCEYCGITQSLSEFYDSSRSEKTNTEVKDRRLKRYLSDPKFRWSNGDTELHSAVANNDIEAVNALIEAGVDVNAKNKNGWTALRFAKSTEVLNALVKAGVDMEAEDKNGYNELRWRAISGDTEIVNALIKAGADVTASDDGGKNALMMAVMHGHMDIADALIKAGVDINTQDQYGTTALMEAVMFDRADIVNALLHAGADVQIENRSGQTALDLAANFKKLTDTDALKRLERLSRPSSAAIASAGCMGVIIEVFAIITSAALFIGYFL